MTDPEIRKRIHRAVDTTLSGLEGDPLLGQRVILLARQKEEPKMKKKISVGFAIVLALLVMSMTALAAAGLWGVFDFAALRGGTPLEEAANSVQRGITQQGGQTEWATFTLREAICDGKAAYLLFDVKPTDEHTLLARGEVKPEDEAWALGLDEAAPEGMTVAQWAEEHGYTRIVWFDVQPIAPFAGNSAFRIVKRMEDGMMLSLRGEYDWEDQEEVAFRCLAWTADGQRESTELTARLTLQEPLWTVTSTQPMDYPEAGVYIHSVTVTGTVMSAYVDMLYSVTDRERYTRNDVGLMFQFLNESGEPMKEGGFYTIRHNQIDRPNGSKAFDWSKDVLTRDFQAFEETPEKIGVQAYNWFTQEYENPVFFMLE